MVTFGPFSCDYQYPHNTCLNNLAVLSIYHGKALDREKVGNFSTPVVSFRISHSLQGAKFVLIENKRTTLFNFLVVLKILAY